MTTDIYHLKLGINSCYLIGGRKGIIMVDAGPPNKIRSFIRKLARLHIHPEDIKLIVITHSHFDHAGSAKEIKDLTGAKIIIHEIEKIYLEESGMIIPKGVNIYGKITKPLLFPILSKISFLRPKADILVNNNGLSLQEFGLNGSIIHTPGHTPGSLTVLLNSGEAFVGCMAHNNFPFRINPGLPIYALDIEKVKESWKMLIEKGARTIFPGHGNPFPVEVMKRELSL
jgi:glyoxylase-like metal-dependent hydrolase (beta-lactamase superfamily II)